ncbi:hypothetical protein GCM10012275_53740 [Longimycelium tulufanense]|uniref:Uncharacterized protein n=1 Tax=Longimycelium tulufanense TaxID=907463 RepID=A0A8J3CD35_9PSEU|nr:hypothetical protein GCM10012275_53740 [Longimycelium tulufanense]
MPRHTVRFLEYARDQYAGLDAETRDQIDQLIECLAENTRECGTYDACSDWWSTTVSSGRVLVTYTVVPSPPTMIVLRLLLFG